MSMKVASGLLPAAGGGSIARCRRWVFWDSMGSFLVDRRLALGHFPVLMQSTFHSRFHDTQKKPPLGELWHFK